MKIQIKPIEECAEVIPGFSLKARAEHEPEGSHYIIMAKHVKDTAPFTYNVKSSDVLRMSIDKDVSKYEVKKGDVLFISRGFRNDAAVIEAIPENTVASSTFYVLRPKSNVISEYLAWCLNQLNAQGKIDQIRTGAGTPIIQRQLVKEFSIPLGSLEEQKQIADLSLLMHKERHLRKELLQLTETLHDGLSKKILGGKLHFK